MINRYKNVANYKMKKFIFYIQDGMSIYDIFLKSSNTTTTRCVINGLIKQFYTPL